jgi:hypothetical protein
LAFTRWLWQRGNYYSRQDAEPAACVSVCASPAASERDNFPNRRVPSPRPACPAQQRRRRATWPPGKGTLSPMGRSIACVICDERSSWPAVVLVEFYDPVSRTATRSAAARRINVGSWEKDGPCCSCCCRAYSTSPQRA